VECLDVGGDVAPPAGRSIVGDAVEADLDARVVAGLQVAVDTASAGDAVVTCLVDDELVRGAAADAPVVKPFRGVSRRRPDRDLAVPCPAGAGAFAA
jgi:hypothetical protein